MTLTNFKPFELAKCPVTGNLEQLDPVYGLSLDGLASKHRIGEIEFPVPWALHGDIGFETRFHSRKVCNFFFEPLHHGYTKGNMLVCFSERVAWMRNLGIVARDGVKNLWRAFLQDVVRNIRCTHLPETATEDRWFSFRAEVKINSRWFSVRPPTVAGCVVDVPDFATGREKPCEVPITFRDFDYLLTMQLLGDLDPLAASLGVRLRWETFCEKFFDSDVVLEELKRLRECRDILTPEQFVNYLSRGHGFLGMWKGEQEAFGVPVKIPQLELRRAPAGGVLSR